MYSTQTPSLSSQSARIPLLAIRAANELDEVAHGRIAYSASARELGDLLLNSFSMATDANAPVPIKSGTVAVFCHAIEGLQQGSKVTSFKELVTMALDYAKTLEAADGNPEKSEVERMKLFCIALSRAAATFRSSIHERKPPVVRRK